MSVHHYSDEQAAAMNFIQAENFIEFMITVLMHRNKSNVFEC